MPDVPDNSLRESNGVLSHEETEIEIQAAAKLATRMRMESLKVARARLADMLAAAATSNARLAERIRVRGSAVHAEIQKREAQASGKSILRGVYVGLRYTESDVRNMTTFN